MVDPLHAPRSHLRAQSRRGRRIQREIGANHNAILGACHLNRDEFIDYVGAHRIRSALKWIAPTAAAARTHDHLGVDRHAAVIAGSDGKIVFAGQAQQIFVVLSGLATPKPPRRAFRAPGVLEIPLALDQITYPHLEPDTAAIFTWTSRVAAQFARLD